jgi:hypothetical protein
MAVPTCARCDRPATTTIPAVDEYVCNEHAAEFWQALLRCAVRRPRAVAPAQSSETGTRTPPPALLWRPRRRAARASAVVASLCARRIQVVLYRDAMSTAPPGSLAAENSQTVDARVVGAVRDLDLALLKIDR